jgi:hypothetical protein
MNFGMEMRLNDVKTNPAFAGAELKEGGTSEGVDLLALAASKVERWDQFRESWERYYGMDIASEEILKHYNSGTLNEGAGLLLTQGVDATME